MARLPGLDALLFQRNFGLILLTGPGREALRPLVWDAVSEACESLYFIGPLADKPVPRGPAPARFFECALAERVRGVTVVLRLDSHGIQTIGDATPDLLLMLAQAAEVGSLCVAEVDAPGRESALAALLEAIPDRQRAASTLLAIVEGPADAPQAWLPGDAARQAISEGSTASAVLALP
jgi:hypothetical protein